MTDMEQELTGIQERFYQSSQRLSGQQPLPVLVLESGSRPDGRNPHTGEPDL